MRPGDAQSVRTRVRSTASGPGARSGRGHTRIRGGFVDESRASDPAAGEAKNPPNPKCSRLCETSAPIMITINSLGKSCYVAAP